MMHQFRKKPVVIEAYCFDGKRDNPRPYWFQDAVTQNMIVTFQDRAIISTIEGDMSAMLGDWIIKGVKGELYPCKPDIFAATYDPVIADDEFTCIACDKVVQEGELVLHKFGEGGLIHAECLGPERESYCHDDGEPLGPDDPLPTPFPYKRDM